MTILNTEMREREREREFERFEGDTSMALKMEMGTMSQGMWAVSSSWERQENRLSLRASRRKSTLLS